MRIAALGVALLVPCGALDVAAAGGHRHAVTALAVSDHQVITGGVDGSLRQWSRESFALIGALGDDSSRSAVVDLAFSPGGDLAVAQGWGGVVEVWRGPDRLRDVAAFTGRVQAVTWLGDRLVAVGEDRDPGRQAPQDDEDEIPTLRPPEVRVFDANGTVTHAFTGLKGTPWAVATSADGQRLAAGGNGDEVLVWSVADGSSTRLEAPGEVGVLQFGADALVAMGSRGTLRAAYPIGSTLQTLELTAPARAGWAADGWLAAAGHENVTISKPVSATVTGRAYEVVGVSDELWILLSDRIVRVGQGGNVIASHPLK